MNALDLEDLEFNTNYIRTGAGLSEARLMPSIFQSLTGLNKM